MAPHGRWQHWGWPQCGHPQLFSIASVDDLAADDFRRALSWHQADNLAANLELDVESGNLALSPEDLDRLSELHPAGERESV